MENSFDVIFLWHGNTIVLTRRNWKTINALLDQDFTEIYHICHISPCTDPLQVTFLCVVNILDIICGAVHCSLMHPLEWRVLIASLQMVHIFELDCPGVLCGSSWSHTSPGVCELCIPHYRCKHPFIIVVILLVCHCWVMACCPCNDFYVVMCDHTWWKSSDHKPTPGLAWKRFLLLKVHIKPRYLAALNANICHYIC